MAQAKAPKRLKDTSPYFDGLQGEVKTRYTEKIGLCDGLDPHKIPTDKWITDDSKVPPLGYRYIVDYFMVKKNAFTNQKFKALKSLGSHNQVTAYDHEMNVGLNLKGQLRRGINLYVLNTVCVLLIFPSHNGIHVSSQKKHNVAGIVARRKHHRVHACC